jgi:cell wall-associated NlpC family hydrolase
MVKKFIAASAIALVMAGCSASIGATNQASAVAVKQVVEPAQVNLVKKVSLMAEGQRVQTVIRRLESRIGKTWYVFSGDTPAGWDCSGLVMWAYQQLGINVPHSANKLGHLNKGVKDPRPGDIVVWAYGKSTSYYHAAIYIGNGKVIHSGFYKGTTTQIISLSSMNFKGSTPKFIRLIQTL